MSVIRLTALASAAVAATAAALLGAAGPAAASTGGIIGLCPQGDYNARLLYHIDNQIQKSVVVVAHDCKNITLPPGSYQLGVEGTGRQGSFVLFDKKGNETFSVTSGGQNYHIYALGTRDGEHHYEAFPV